MWRPVRMVSLKLRWVHLPRPVSLSGVRFAVKLTPHGPDHAVFVAAAETIHGPSGFGAGGTAIFSGWPESMRLMSGSGPFEPTFQGVWQSLQPATVTRYFPRASLSSAWTGQVLASRMRPRHNRDTARSVRRIFMARAPVGTASVRRGRCPRRRER